MTIKPAYKNELNPAHPENEAPIEEVFRFSGEIAALACQAEGFLLQRAHIVRIGGQRQIAPGPLPVRPGQ